MGLVRQKNAAWVLVTSRSLGAWAGWVSGVACTCLNCGRMRPGGVTGGRVTRQSGDPPPRTKSAESQLRRKRVLSLRPAATRLGPTHPSPDLACNQGALDVGAVPHENAACARQAGLGGAWGRGGEEG